MSQHDYNIANADGASVRSDINNALGAIVTWNSGASDPATTFARMRAVNTTSGVVKRRNAANSAWIVESTDDETRVIIRAANTILDVSDIGKCFVATATFTQTLDAVATLSDGWWCSYRVEAGSTVTFDPNGAETIDGAATLAVVGPASLHIYCNGSQLLSVSIEQPASDTVAGKIEIATQAEQVTGTDTTRAVVSGRQVFNSSALKAWGEATATGSLAKGFNMDAPTDTGTGVITWNISADFDGVNYTAVPGIRTASFNGSARNSSQNAGQVEVTVTNYAGVATDPDSHYILCAGVRA